MENSAVILIIPSASYRTGPFMNAIRKLDLKVLVISDKLNSQIERYVKQGKIKFKKTKLKDAVFLSKYKPYLVMATTSDRILNRKIVEKARKMKSYAYASDDPEISDFAHPSVINIADTIQVAISTGGSSPAMARKIKLKAESFLKKNISNEDIYQIKLQKFARFEAKQVLSTQLDRKKFLYAVMNDKHVKALLKEGKYKIACLLYTSPSPRD